MLIVAWGFKLVCCLGPVTIWLSLTAAASMSMSSPMNLRPVSHRLYFCRTPSQQTSCGAHLLFFAEGWWQIMVRVWNISLKHRLGLPLFRPGKEAELIFIKGLWPLVASVWRTLWHKICMWKPCASLSLLVDAIYKNQEIPSSSHSSHGCHIVSRDILKGRTW